MARDFDVEVHNAEVIAGLRRLERVIPNTVIEAASVAANKAKARITKYPPELPNQQYQRTGTYGNAWAVVRVREGWKLIGSAKQGGRDYTHYVAGDEHGLDQARIHQGRWVRARKAVDDEVRDLEGVSLDPSIEAALRAAGF